MFGNEKNFSSSVANGLGYPTAVRTTVNKTAWPLFETVRWTGIGFKGMPVQVTDSYFCVTVRYVLVGLNVFWVVVKELAELIR